MNADRARGLASDWANAASALWQMPETDGLEPVYRQELQRMGVSIMAEHLSTLTPDVATDTTAVVNRPDQGPAVVSLVESQQALLVFVGLEAKTVNDVLTIECQRVPIQPGDAIATVRIEEQSYDGRYRRHERWTFEFGTRYKLDVAALDPGEEDFPRCLARFLGWEFEAEGVT
jgi:hypothetical protein